MKKRKKLTISRKRWLRGEGSGPSSLLRPADSKMCCLGTYLRSCGVKAGEISGTASPWDIFEEMLPKQTKWLLSFIDNRKMHSTTCMLLMSINDNVMLKDKDRETKIVKEFASQSVDVKFVE